MDYRKLLIAQMIACNDADIHSVASVVGAWVELTPEELAAYHEASADAEHLLDMRADVP